MFSVLFNVLGVTYPTVFIFNVTI